MEDGNSFVTNLYGRQDVIDELQKVYQRVVANTINLEGIGADTQLPHPPSRQRELVLIKGEAGSGKTALALTLQATVQRDGGIFGCGKFGADGSTGSIAAEALPLTMALAEWVQQILQPQQKTFINLFREEARDQLSEESLALLYRIIPGLETIMTDDDCEGIRPLDRANNRSLSCNRNLAKEATKVILSKIILVFCSVMNAPIVLFLDDLQWSDNLTLSIVHAVLTNDEHQNNKLLMVGAYRDDNPISSDPLHRMLHSLQDHEQVVVTPIYLLNLTEQAVREMILDVLKCSDENSEKIANNVYRQTKGNALFVRQVVHSLLQDEIVGHQVSDQASRADCVGAGDENQDPPFMPNLPENSGPLSCGFLDATVNRMTQNDRFVRYQLEVAACLGNNFPMSVWQVALLDLDTSDVIDDGNKKNTLVMHGYLEMQVDDMGSTVLHWKHDLVWQAAYSLLPENERSARHVSLGRKLMKRLSQSQIDENIFLILSQWSHGATLLSSPQERTCVAKLCLVGGEKAALLSSFETAWSCLNLGIRLMDFQGNWQNEYELTLRLYSAAVEASFCVVKFDQMEKLVDSVLIYARTYKDSLRARTMQIYALGSRGRQAEAYDHAIETLRHLGVTFPNPKFYVLDYLWTWKKLQGKRDRTLLSLPVMKDDSKLAAMSILFFFVAICSCCRPQMLPSVTTCLIRLTLKYGLCPASSQAFLSYGMSRLFFGKRREALRFGQLALQIIQTMKANEFLPRSYMVMYTFINPWNHPLRDSLDPLEYAFRAGLETGDIDTAVKSRFYACKLLLWAGKSLPDVRAATTKSLDMAKLYKHDSMVVIHKLMLQFLDNFTIKTDDPLVLSGASADQREAYQIAQRLHNQYVRIDIPTLRLWLAVHMNNYELAIEMAAKSWIAIKRSKTAYFIVCLQRFYEGVAACELSYNVNKTHFIKLANKNLKELKQFERDAPENCNNKVLLLEAELAARENKLDVAIEKFEQSMDRARFAGFAHEEALACELAGIVLQRRYDYSRAALYLIKARDLYKQWGADVKVQQMLEIYGTKLRHS